MGLIFVRRSESNFRSSSSVLAAPVIDGHDYSVDEALLGFECCTWSEYIDNPTTLENRMFPRLYALAENAWSGGKEADYGDFCRRLKALICLNV